MEMREEERELGLGGRTKMWKRSKVMRKNDR